MPKLSVVLPCYNESKSISNILKRFSQAKNNDTELILVNNGSTDNTTEVLKKELPKYKFVRSVLVEKNHGYGYGIMSGLKHAKGEYLAFSHADLQCDPADVFRAFDLMQKQKEPERILVKGGRKGRRNILTAGLHLLAGLLFLRRFDDINGQPKVFHRFLFEKLKNPPKDFAFDFYVQYIALKNGYRVLNIPVTFAKRKHGQSHWASTLRSRSITIAKFIKYMVKLRIFGD